MLHAQIKGRIARRIEERVRHLSTPLASFQKGGVLACVAKGVRGPAATQARGCGHHSFLTLGGGGRVVG